MHTILLIGEVGGHMAGALGDMGCHLIDVPFKTLGLQYPKAVECSVGQVFIKMWSPEYIPEDVLHHLL